MEEDLTPSPDGPIHPPSPFLIVANKFMGGPVILNVGGKRLKVGFPMKILTQKFADMKFGGTHWTSSQPPDWVD